MTGADSQQAVLSCEQLTRVYLQGSREITVLDQLSLQVCAGERVAVMGASGSGKSTLLGLLGALDRPSAGQVIVDGRDVSKLDDTALSKLRNQSLGFVYQFHHLLPEFNALENVAMPLMIAGEKTASAMVRAEGCLQRVGLEHRLSHRPDALSGGERQRVAIARALVNEPRCVLMDEPTGNLDEQSSASVLDLIDELSTQLKTAFVLVTHDREVAAVMDSCYWLHEGRLQPMPAPTSAT